MYTFTNNIGTINCDVPSKIIAGYSTNIGGYSTGNYNSLNVGLNTNDDRKIVEKNRIKLFNTIAPNRHVAYANQTHQTLIQKADENNLYFDATDGLYTQSNKILLTITTADCGSVLIYNENKPFVAALHCGWKSVHGGIIKNLESILNQIDKPQNFNAIIGPMIQQNSYEVGTEFCDLFDNKYLQAKKSKFCFDLNLKILDELTEIGITNIHNINIDTYTSSDFYSYRKNSTTGRFCGYIGIF